MAAEDRSLEPRQTAAVPPALSQCPAAPDAPEIKYRSYDDLPLTLKVENLMPILGIGRNTAYELVRSGQIRSVKVGRQLRIPKQALIDYLK